MISSVPATRTAGNLPEPSPDRHDARCDDMVPTFNIEGWWTTLSSSSDSSISEFYSYVQKWEERAASLPNHIYTVSHWMEYLDRIDDIIILHRTSKPDVSLRPQETEFWRQMSQARDWVGRRAVFHLPRSYKLWKCVWEFLGAQSLRNATAADADHIRGMHVVSCMERAVQTLSSFPRVWIVYLSWLLDHPVAASKALIASSPPIHYHTHVRRTLNRALQSVAVTQHGKIWQGSGIIDRFMSFRPTLAEEDERNDSFWPWESMNRILRRYIQYSTTSDPSFLFEYASWCEKYGRYGPAALAYVSVLNSASVVGPVDGGLVNVANMTDQQRDMAWQSFTELVAQHSEDVEAAGISWESILRTAIQQHIEAQKSAGTDDINNSSSSSNSTTMLGLLYSWLASAWIQRGSFDMAMSVYEEGLLYVSTVRDFSVLYSSYLTLTEGLLNALTDSIGEEEEDVTISDAAAMTDSEETDWDLLLGDQTHAGRTINALSAMEMAMARAEHLTARRPLLLNAVKLRQDLNDCASYLERADLQVAAEQPRQAATTLEEGLQTVVNGGSDARKKKRSEDAATISHMVIRLVRVYEECLQDVDAARDLLDRVCRQRSTALGIVHSEDLAECWAAWIEFELKHEDYVEALSLSRQSVAGDPLRHKRKGVRSLNLTKSLRLWDLLLDLEESLGTVQTTKDAYNRALEIKSATVHQVMNFASFLTEQKYFEEALSAYERGVELFSFPHPGAKLLWRAYIKAFLQRYKGTKIERARSMFERCLENCPSEECAEFCMMNGEFEEEYGLTNRALSVYQNMCEKVPSDEKYTAYQLFIAKTVKYLGLAATRDIYQDAIAKLAKVNVSLVVKMCIDYAKMEVGLNQVARARAIFMYGAQSADPRRMPEFWQEWNDCEIASGNEDSFREMLRVKRGVEAAFSTVNYNAIGMTDTVSNFTNEEAMRMIAAGEGMDFDDAKNASTSVVSGFVPSTSNKRVASVTTLDDVEERVAKLRKIKGESMLNEVLPSNEVNGYGDDNEIDLDEIDAEINEAANEVDAHSSAEMPQLVHDVTTKAVPEAVFGSLAALKSDLTRARP
jgi:pre-mRNA-splicing factor SYF1